MTLMNPGGVTDFDPSPASVPFRLHKLKSHWVRVKTIKRAMPQVSGAGTWPASLSLHSTTLVWFYSPSFLYYPSLVESLNFMFSETSKLGHLRLSPPYCQTSKFYYCPSYLESSCINLVHSLLAVEGKQSTTSHESL